MTTFTALCSNQSDADLNIDVFLDWFNNYLTIECMADHYGLSTHDMNLRICRGRFWNETLARN
jgi:hypothetical protein